MRRNEESEYFCQCLCCHQGDESSGAAFLQFPIFWGFIWLFCDRVVPLAQLVHLAYDLSYPQMFFLKNKHLFSQLFPIFYLDRC